jgi:hypothetical protein
MRALIDHEHRTMIDDDCLQVERRENPKKRPISDAALKEWESIWRVVIMRGLEEECGG